MPISRSNNNVTGITLGDPFGIGPEIVAKALSKRAIQQCGPLKIIGDRTVFRRYRASLPKHCTFVDLNIVKPGRWRPGTMNRTGGRAALAALESAVELYRNGEIGRLVTAPVSKEAVGRIQPAFRGHTEFLARALNTKNVGMMFVARNLRTVIVTRHVPLKQVAAKINASNIYETIALTEQALKQMFKIKNPLIAVCGLNPHAGEGGAIGREEITKIIPAIQKARQNKIRVRGPFAADTLFKPQTTRLYDCFIAMYHDQGLIPVKTLDIGNCVNVTLGLPLIRTSPAHGTAFDIAGQNKADPSSMCAAIALAAKLSK